MYMSSFVFFISTSYRGQKNYMLPTLLCLEVAEREVDYEVGIPGSSSGSTSICGLDRPFHLSRS